MYFQHEGSDDFIVVKKGESLDFLETDIFDERTKKNMNSGLLKMKISLQMMNQKRSQNAVVVLVRKNQMHLLRKKSQSVNVVNVKRLKMIRHQVKLMGQLKKKHLNVRVDQDQINNYKKGEINYGSKGTEYKRTALC